LKQEAREFLNDVVGQRTEGKKALALSFFLDNYFIDELAN
jgi:hypothetical protein